MTVCIVDENVPIVANDVARITAGLDAVAPEADEACRLAAIQRLRALISKGTVAIDDGGEVIARYRKHLSGKGQPGVGDYFLKYVSDNSFSPNRVVRFALQRTDKGEYADFPDDAELRRFDRDDRVFVALALTAGDHCSIINAVDSDYLMHRSALMRHGVTVEELCPNCLKV